MEEYEAELKSGDKAKALTALRNLLVDYLIHETGNENRCPKCQTLQTRSSDIASIALRLMKLIEDTETVSEEGEEDGLTRIRRQHTGIADPSLPPPTDLGSKRSARRSGGYRTSEYGGPAT